MDIADCYRVLGLTSVATAQEVKSSYRRLARQWHPDVNPNNQHAHDMFIRVTEAYKVLLTVTPASQSASKSSSTPSAASPPSYRTSSPTRKTQPKPNRTQPPLPSLGNRSLIIHPALLATIAKRHHHPTSRLPVNRSMASTLIRPMKLSSEPMSNCKTS
ncbi:MAG: J domain-containing protein [Acaryochloridaceae cyanobacterium RL_2_7]|nr:J domain-containing protein [Acaryochloridaceae cyanobacterium RL_2_7]